MRTRSILFIFPLLASFATAFSAETWSYNKWKWIYGQSSGSEWRVEEGTAEVEINGEKLSGKLFNAKDPSVVDHLVEGKIIKGKVELTVTTVPSDSGGNLVKGTYLRYEFGLDHAETITAKNEWWIFGLTRIQPK